MDVTSDSVSLRVLVPRVSCESYIPTMNKGLQWEGGRKGRETHDGGHGLARGRGDAAPEIDGVAGGDLAPHVVAHVEPVIIIIIFVSGRAMRASGRGGGRYVRCKHAVHVHWGGDI